MSSIDPGKLKVVELRAELGARGLDTKGNKPVLVKRLKEALENEIEQELPDTSIADTSTEEINTSQESVSEDVQAVPPDKTTDEPLESPPIQEEEPEKLPDKPKMAEETTKEPLVEEKQTEKPSEEEPKAEAEEEKQQQQPQTEDDDAASLSSSPVEKENELGTSDAPEIEEKTEAKPGTEDVDDEDDDEEMPLLPVAAATAEENGENVDHEMQETGEDKVAEEKPEEVAAEIKAVPEDQHKGEKRRRSSPSPERSQRRRSKTPIKEDEPVLDNNKVQLSWYDSDLHLQVDKKSLLSGKPYHEGAFGYAWAGARATHGIKTGKACFEVKITEELKWDDLVRQQTEKRRDSHHKHENSKRERSSRTEKENSKADSTKKDDNPDDKDIKTEAIKEEAEEEEEKPKDDGDDDANNKPTEEAEVKKEETETQEDVDSSKEETERPQQEAMDVADEPPAEPIAKHLFRVGWSLLDSGLQLGETEHSFGYESTGKFVDNKTFTDYGVKYGAGDVVGAYINVDAETVTLTYTVNGEPQPVAVSLPKSDLPDDFVLFPHVLTRNYSFQMNAGANEEPWFPHPATLDDGYVHLEKLEDKVQGPVRPESRSECEVIMMCGLPAAGKTHWVREMVKENPSKRYTVIGNSHLLEKMTVNGHPLKNSYKGRWNVILDRLMKCVNILVEAAALRRRNYVIDQTNVFPSAQRRKMRLFEGFKRRAVVVVVSDEEQARRRAQQEAQDGKDVPDSAILEMKANMSLPRRGDWIEEVAYVELGEDDAKALIQKYNQQGREAGFGPIGGQRSGYRDNRGHPYRWDHSTSRRDYRGGYRDNRSYQNNRYDRSRQHGGWQNRRPPPGSWNRDIRRDGRGPPGGGGNRDFRNNRSSGGGGGGGNRQNDRSGNRDNRNRSQSGGGGGGGSNYNRNQRPQNNRNQSPANWQGGGGGGGGSWQSQGSWSGGGGQGMWNQSWGQGGNWSGQTQQWKSGYGGGQGGYGQSGGYGGGNYPNWNYYGQYAQNWNNQGQPQTITAGGGGSGGTSATSDSSNATYGQQYSQQAWAQYAQQYAQGQSTTTTTTSSSSSHQQSSQK